MKTKTLLLALAAGFIGLADTSQASISSISGRSFTSGDRFDIRFDSSTGSIANHAWIVNSRQAVNMPPFFSMPAYLEISQSWYTNQWTASSLSEGDMIDSSNNFTGGANIQNSLPEVYFGIRTNTETSYGANNGEIYYGWVKISYDISTGAGQVLGAAINTTAGQGITAGQTAAAVPEPSALALLGLGTVGLAARRRRK